jgi:hypothetical protein
MGSIARSSDFHMIRIAGFLTGLGFILGAGFFGFIILIGLGRGGLTGMLLASSRVQNSSDSSKSDEHILPNNSASRNALSNKQ